MRGVANEIHAHILIYTVIIHLIILIGQQFQWASRVAEQLQSIVDTIKRNNKIRPV